MTISLTKEDEQVVVRMVNAGYYSDAQAAVHDAVQQLAACKGRPVFPPGSLVELYTGEENEKEARLARALQPNLEAF